MIDLIARYAPALMRGLGVTLALTGIIWSVGMVGGVALGVAVRSRPALWKALKIFVVIMAAIPVLVVLMWLHYPAQAILGVVIDPFITTAFALSLVNILFVADVVSRTIAGLPQEWTLAARTAGLSAADISRHVTLPLATRQLIGPIVFIQVSMLQATLFGSLISVNELFRTVQQINSIEYQPVELYTILALFFLAVCAPLQLFAASANRRFSKDISLR